MLREKRRLLLLVRTGLTLAIGYLMVFSSGAGGLPTLELAFVLLYVGSNAIIATLPARVLAMAKFDVGLILIDTAAISFALYVTPHIGSEVFVFYFVIILLASTADRLMISYLAPLVTGGAYLAFAFLRYGLDGMLRPSVLLCLPFFLLTGVFYGFFVERTRRGRALALAARQRAEARTEFLSLVTHDLKQPLWVAQESTALLYEKLGPEPSELRTLAAQVLVNLRRMEALALNFLDFSRIESRGVQVFPRQASLNRVLEDLLDSYRPAFDLKKVRAQLELSPALPAAWIDPQQLERGLANLLDNAVKFTPEGGLMTCRTAADNGWVSVTIADSGPGINPERAATLFTPFQTGTDAAGRRSSGLGLHIAWAIVDALGGEITIEPHQGRGAWFHVRLLAAPPPQR